MITLRHSKLKLQKLQLKVEAVETAEPAGEISKDESETGRGVEESKLAQYMKEVMREKVGQCRERMVSFLLENRRVKVERDTEETTDQK